MFSRFGVWHQRRALSEVLGMRIFAKKKKPQEFGDSVHLANTSGSSKETFHRQTSKCEAELVYLFP